MFDKPSEKLLISEKKQIEDLFECIDKKQSTIFDAGAGAGKTYTLIECLRYTLKNYGKKLKHDGQKIVCITYTNAAADEIKRRLGSSDLVLISTIHDRLWNFIKSKSYREELLSIHKDFMKKKIKQWQEDIKNQKEFQEYNLLTEEEKEEFYRQMVNIKNIYRKHYNDSAKDFKDIIKSKITEDYHHLLKNVSNFKKITNISLNIHAYNDFISNNEEVYVRYDSLNNSDILQYGKFSHDTLLEYSFDMIKEYDLLKRFIVDSYPYFFIDEYQDTDEKVIAIMKLLKDYSKQINHSIYVGYFGDSVQNIYDSGIGERIFENNSDFKNITLTSNRRSCKEVIEAANKIRNDKLLQMSIFDDAIGGSIEFYYLKDSSEKEAKENLVNKFISEKAREYKTSRENPTHCFLLLNKMVAHSMGFGEIYDFFSKTTYYKTYYNQLNTEFLNDDINKLGKIPRILFNIILFIEKLSNDNTLVNEIINKNSLKKDERNAFKIQYMDQLSNIINGLQSIRGNTLKDCIARMQSLQQEDIVGQSFRQIIKDNIGLNNISVDVFESELLQNLYPDYREEKLDEIKQEIKSFMDIDLNIFIKWYKYCCRDYENDIIYHTFHGTKGLEYDNVIIIMGNSFGKQKSYFDVYFSNYNQNIVDENIQDIYRQARNLLYVSVTRAKKNLRILYTDDISKFKQNIERIFKTVKFFS